jgi:hypothetical protein
MKQNEAHVSQEELHIIPQKTKKIIKKYSENFFDPREEGVIFFNKGGKSSPISGPISRGRNSGKHGNPGGSHHQ